MKEIVFITGNDLKFDVAKKALADFGFELIQKRMETPEIQSMDNVEVASYSARWASNELQKPAVVTDAGYYIKALNGFPGPFIKWINKWLKSEDILNLMKDKENRCVEAIDCLAYCEPGGEPVTFVRVSKGNIALGPGKNRATPIDELFIPEGYEVPASDIPWEEMREFWGKGADGTWKQLAEYLETKNTS